MLAFLGRCLCLRSSLFLQTVAINIAFAVNVMQPQERWEAANEDAALRQVQIAFKKATRHAPGVAWCAAVDISIIEGAHRAVGVEHQQLKTRH